MLVITDTCKRFALNSVSPRWVLKWNPSSTALPKILEIAKIVINSNRETKCALYDFSQRNTKLYNDANECTTTAYNNNNDYNNILSGRRHKMLQSIWLDFM